MRHTVVLMITTAMVPVASMAQNAIRVPIFPVEMSITAFLIISGLLILSLILFFVFQKRFNSTHKELTDLTIELNSTRQRLTETKKTLEETDQNLKNTTQYYQEILSKAQVGIFQMDLDGTCTYINPALEVLSGLYPKKAFKEGIQCAIHPDDCERFNQEWTLFTENNKSRIIPFRFLHPRGGPEIHVLCKAAKVLNKQSGIECYIGWVLDVTLFHEEQLRQEATTARYAHFISETIEGYYQLTLETPIPLSTPPEEMAKTIMSEMVLTSCNKSFADLYNSTPATLEGCHINTLDGGCGLLKNDEHTEELIKAEFKQLNIESVRQDSRGNQIILLNNVIGLIEDNALVGIWGSQQNITQQKREQEALESQTHFMHRILDALPADVCVKDTRCRYLYASRKLAYQTGIPKEKWIGKTIFEVMPATPRDHDKASIEVMKSKKLTRTEYSDESQGKTSYTEILQKPLVSNDDLVEGIVELSIDITERKEKEEELRLDILRKLHLREAELEEKQAEFLKKLDERKLVEAELRQNEKNLLSLQKQLKEQLSSRLIELETETDKRKKWEELISIKEEELRKIENYSNARNKQLEEEIANRKQAEAHLKTNLAELEIHRKGTEALEEERKKEITNLTEQKQKELTTEKSARKQAESQLKKAENLLQKTLAKIKELSLQHATELEHEISERNAARTQLLRNTAELNELKQQFDIRIKQETKQLKQELAQKQIREKALRQQEKKLEDRIHTLEKNLQDKIKEHNQQIQAHKQAEDLRKQAEKQLEQLNTRQNQLIEREAQKLDINIAEIRLGEIKLHKEISNLQQEKEQLEKELQKQLDQDK